MKLYQKAKDAYDNLKIQTKFTLCILFAVSIPLLSIAVLFSDRLYDMVIADTIRNEQNATMQIGPKIEDTLNEVIDFHEFVTALSYYQTLFYQPVSTSLAKLAATNDALDFADQIKNKTAESAVTAVRIYLDIPGQSVFYENPSAKDLFLPVSRAKGTYWYGIFQGSSVSVLHCPSFYLGNREKTELGDLALITETWLYYQGTSYPCYTAIYYSAESFHRILSDAATSRGSVSYIINDREAVISSTDDYLAAIYRLSYDDICDSLMSTNNFVEHEILSETVYVGYYYIKSPAWIIVTALPKQPLIERGNSIILKLAFLCISCTLAAAFFTLRQTRSVTSRISSVIRQMSQIRQSPPVALPDPVIHDEVGELIQTFNYMTERMNFLIAQQQKTAEDLRIAEFNSLQAQINPHFLYNTMDMINWMALEGKTADVSNAVQNLARFYKLTLSRKNNFSSVENELEHVSIYLDLQNMRFHNAIEFVIDLPDHLYGCGIPKLTLQPIVENALLHGILEKEEKSGTILITGWEEEDMLVLLVSDDGVGIPGEKLPQILSGSTRKTTSSGTNIAVYNTHKRLKLLYGERYGLHYESTFGKGTDVQIRLPRKPAEP